MLNRRSLSGTVAVLSLSFLTAGAAAQPANEIISPPRPQPVAERAEVRLLDITFPGGTLAEFADAVRKAAEPEPVNVVLLGDAGTLEIPAVTLRRVTAEAAFVAVCPKVFANVMTLPSAGIPIITIEPNLSEADRRRIDILTRRSATTSTSAEMNQPQRPAEPTHLRVYSVRDFVDGKDITYETVLDALRTALSVGDEEPKAEVLHHEASGVLIVRGTQAQQNAAEQLLSAVQQNRRAIEEAEAERADERAHLVHQLQSAMQAARDYERNVLDKRAQLELARNPPEGFHAPAEQVMDAERDVEDAEFEKAQADAEVRTLRAQLDALDAAAGPESAQQIHRRAELEGRLRTLGFQVRRAQIDVRATEEALVEAEKLAEGNFVPPSSVTQARQNYEGAKLNKEQAEAEHAALKDQLAALDTPAIHQPSAPKEQVSVTWEYTFKTISSELVAPFFDTMSRFLRESGAQGTLTVARDGAQIRLEFVGNAEATRHFQALCQLVSRMDQSRD